MNQENYLDDDRDEDRLRNENEIIEQNREHARELEQDSEDDALD